MGFFLVQWDEQQKLGRFCEATKPAKLLWGERGELLNLLASTIRRKEFFVRRDQVGLLNNYETPLVFSPKMFPEKFYHSIPTS
jgi:hypothetical protein